MTGFDRKGMGIRLSQKRIEKGLSQEEVANIIEVGRSTYNTIEAGKRPLKDNELSALAELLETTTDYLLRGKDSENVDICAVTGLTNDAISFFTKRNDNENMLGEYLTITDCLNCLLSTQQGIKVLAALGDYLECDFSTVYTDQTGDGLAFEPLKSSVGFEIKHKYIEGRKTYYFLNPELLEQSAQTLLIKNIMELKSELQQPKPEQKKRVRKEK